jgi:hypothetical protein
MRYALRRLGVFGLVTPGEFLIDRVLTQPSAKADIGKAEARRRRADLDSAPILVHMVLIDCWPNDLGRFASSVTARTFQTPSPKSINRQRVPILGA